MSGGVPRLRAFFQYVTTAQTRAARSRARSPASNSCVVPDDWTPLRGCIKLSPSCSNLLQPPQAQAPPKARLPHPVSGEPRREAGLPVRAGALELKLTSVLRTYVGNGVWGPIRASYGVRTHKPARAAPAKNKLSRFSLGFNSNTRPPPGRAGQTWVKCTSLTLIGTAGYWYNENAAASGRGPRRLHRVGKASSEESRLKSAPCPLLLTPTDIICSLLFPLRTLPHTAALPSLRPSLHPYKAGPLQCWRSPLASHPHSLVSCALRNSLPFELTNTCRIRTLEEDKERFALSAIVISAASVHPSIDCGVPSRPTAVCVHSPNSQQLGPGTPIALRKIKTS
jgi:hypothetical protein